MKHFLLLLTFILLPAAASAQSGTAGTSLTWTLSGGTLTISGTGAMTDYDDDTNEAPWLADSDDITAVVIEEGVTTIGSMAFTDCSSLTSITIPASVATIGDLAFDQCASLTSITVEAGNTAYSSDEGVLFNQNKSQLILCPTGKSGTYSIPDGVTTIGSMAFTGCSGLTSITLPASVATIGDMAFSPCENLASITLPTGLTTIGDWTFAGCSSLTSITLPAGLTTIGSGAFYDCSGLTSVAIPAGVTAIGDDAFGSCTNLTSFTVETGSTAYSVVNGVLFNSAGTTLILFPQGISTYVIPNGTTAIGDKAFYSCSGLTDVTIPASVTAIGSEAFAHCSSLSIVNVAWETSPPAITGETFRNKPDGATLYVPEGKQSTYDTETGWKDFAIAEMTTEGGQGWTLTGSTLTITQTIADATSGNAPWYAHRNRIVTVVIENAVTAIGSYAFEDCSNLSAITLPDGVTTIGSHAFRNCSSLSAITLPEGVTTIGDEAFVRCGLTAITLPATATTIGNDAFQSCSNLASIRVDAGNTAFSSDGGVLFNAGKTTLILYPQGKSGSAYAIPDGVETIGSRAFINCAALTSVTIPATLTSIGSYAFSACPALATVAIPAGVETVGEAAFAYSSALTSIAIPGSVTSIGNRAFEDCTGLTSITAGWTTPPRCTRRPVCQCHPVRHHPLRPRRHESRLRGRKRMERLLHRRTLPFGHARNTPFRHSRRNANA